MPVITLANPKGGTGKSTTALVLGTRAVSNGYNVTIIDADPREVIFSWKEKGITKNKINVVGNINENNIIDIIKSRVNIDDIIIIDTEGISSLLLSRAISRSDLVLIPMQASNLDAFGASNILNLIKEEEKTFERSINSRILFTRTNPIIQTKIEKEIKFDLEKNNISILKNYLHQRQAYNMMFAFYKDLLELKNLEKKYLNKALLNADLLLNEILDILK